MRENWPANVPVNNRAGAAKMGIYALRQGDNEKDLVFSMREEDDQVRGEGKWCQDHGDIVTSLIEA